MGLDWIELILDVEEELGVAVDWDELNGVTQNRKPPDMTVGEFHHYLNTEAHRSCAACRYSLKGLPAPGQCPECGHGFDVRTVPIEKVIQLISEFLGVEPEAINAESWMIGDLGME